MSAASPTNSLSEFTVDKAKAALMDVLSALTHPDNVVRLDEARDNAENDMLKYMQIVFPVATQIEMEVIQNYGFTADGEGLIQFTQIVKAFEKEDPDVARLNAEIKSYFIPSLMPPQQPQNAAG